MLKRCLLMAMLTTFALLASAADTARCLLADGFDYPVGKPDAAGYYKFRGYTPNGHLGEDWNGNGGGDTDLGDPIYATARGVVVFSADIRVGWGNCIIVRHAYRDTTGKIEMVDSLYAHLNERKVSVGTIVERGQLVGTMGSNHGMYAVHLHFEMRKNLHIGMNRTDFAQNNTNYYSPSAFIQAHRTLSSGFAKVDIPTGGFAPYGQKLADSAKEAPVSITSGPSSRNFRIPVYKTDTKPTPPATTSSGSNQGKATTKSKSAPAAPAVEPPAVKTSFWSRLKDRFSSGQVTPGVGEKK
jgi:hypothetical protein